MSADVVRIAAPKPIDLVDLSSDQEPPPPAVDEDGKPCVYTFWRTLRLALRGATRLDSAISVELLLEIRRLEHGETKDPILEVSRQYHEALCEAVKVLPLHPMLAGQLRPHQQAVLQAKPRRD